MKKKDELIHALLYCNPNPIEKIILEFFLENDVSKMKMQQVADECNASPSSVNRVCKLLNYQSFTKYKIATDIENNKNTSLDTFDENVELFASSIAKENQLFIVGLGASNLSAKFLSRQLLKLGIFCIYIDDIEMIPLIPNIKNILFTSYSGETTQLIQLIQIYNFENTYSITRANSKIANLSDYALTYKVEHRGMSTYQKEQQPEIYHLITELCNYLYNTIG